MRKLNIKSKELVKAVNDIKKTNEEVKVNNEELVKYDKKRQKLAYKVQRLKDKGVKILHEEILKNHELNEFEYTTENIPVDDETVEVGVNDIFEDNFSDKETLKKQLREDKKEKRGYWAEKLMFTGHKK